MTPASDIDRIAGLQTEARNERTADIDVVTTVEMMGEYSERRVLRWSEEHGAARAAGQESSRPCSPCPSSSQNVVAAVSSPRASLTPEMINAQDMTVALAVQRCIPAVAALVDAVHPRVARGGRVVYVGAGTSGRLGILDASEM